MDARQIMLGMDEQYKSRDDEFHIENGTSDKPILESSTTIEDLGSGNIV